MWLMGGLSGAMLAGYVIWMTAGNAAQNLPGVQGPLTAVLLVVSALACGFVGGAAVFRRAWRTRTRLVLYATVAGAVCGGVMGAIAALTLSFGYLGAYAAWPSGGSADVLLAAAYPVFTLAGGAVGALLGGAVGLVGGGVLRILTPAR